MLMQSQALLTGLTRILFIFNKKSEIYVRIILQHWHSCYHIRVQKRRKETILVVEHDPIIGDLIAHQALEAAGYQVNWVRDSAAAIQIAMQSPPDAIIVNLEMPGLSGKDLMIALTAQRIDIPVVVLARKGMEADIIQAYRLGVVDYLLWPVREAEVLTMIERILKQGRTKKEREMLALALQKTNQELQERVRSMKTIFAVGKAVLSINDQSVLLERILESAAGVVKADISWLMVRSEQDHQFLLAAYHHLPDSLAVYLNQPWDDGISSLVTRSGKTLTLQGEALKKTKLGSMCQAAIIAPIIVQGNTIGSMALVRRQLEPFNETEQTMLEAVCNYASLALVNARLFRAINQQTTSQDNGLRFERLSRKIENERTVKAVREIQTLLLLNHETQAEKADQKTEAVASAVSAANQTIQKTRALVDLLAPPPVSAWGFSQSFFPANALIAQMCTRYRTLAQFDGITLFTELPSSEIEVLADPYLAALLLEALIGNAIRFNRPGGQVIIRLQKSKTQAQITVTDTGTGISSQKIPFLFSSNGLEIQPAHAASSALRPGGPGICLFRAKEIVSYLKGEINVESKPGKGTGFHLYLPLH